MNKDKFFSLLSKEIVKEEDVKERIEKEQALINAGRSFASQLSINRFLAKKLVDFDIEERLNLFSKLVDVDFIYNENPLYWNQMDTDELSYILKEKFELDNMYELDDLYIENILEGKEIIYTELKVDDEEMTLAEILEMFVFYTHGMTPGDTPNLRLMLVVKKALIGSYLSEKNVEALLNGEREIYDIKILK